MTLKSKLYISIALIGVALTLACVGSLAEQTPVAKGGKEANAPAASKALAAPAVPANWMEGIPAVVPPFAGGVLSKDSNRTPVGDNVLYSLYFEGATLDQAKQYLDKMKEAGFQIVMDTSDPENLSFHGGLPQGEGRIGFSFAFQKGGHVDYTINLIKKYQ